MSETNKYSLEGRVKVVMETQTFGSGFEKREFVVTSDFGNEKYPQDIKLECVQGKVALLDGLRVGDEVKACFNLRGSEHKESYYTNLQCWKIEILRKGSGSVAEGAPAVVVASCDVPADFDEDEVPF